MNLEYFATRLRLGGAVRFLIWISNETDGVATDGGNELAHFHQHYTPCHPSR